VDGGSAYTAVPPLIFAPLAGPEELVVLQPAATSATATAALLAEKIAQR